MSLEFEWDEARAASNQKKHGVTFEEAATVFADPLAAIFDDEVHSEEEQREIIIGHSARDRLLLVCFTERGDAIRIISARRATKRERKDYEENPRQ
ncbi:MAG: BrnT family toxin [Gemmataceae bacterium]|nr:BrnT family toxin [Gemmataceae bacterium]